ncbi:hypothetical protein CC80DRAFT_353977, partial [Byssothecium circinans]
ITIIDTTIEVYGAIKDLHGLPEAFQQVNDRLPLVKQILEEVKVQAKNANPSDEKALEKLLEGCEKKATELRKIFTQIAKESTGGEFIISAYRLIVLKLGKKSRVETLMGRILKDLAVLAAHRVFQASARKRAEELEKARQELANVTPSLPDSEFDEKLGSVSQIGDYNRQYATFGGMQKNVDGHYFEAGGNQHFGMVPSK